MHVDTTQLRVIAERVKRQTTNRDIIELCDAAIAASVARSDCKVCAARRVARTAAQRKWRAKETD